MKKKQVKLQGPQNIYFSYQKLIKNINNVKIKTYKPHIFAVAGSTQPAPTELPQDGNVARVGGCSGVM
tara:strand:- start:1731 stop:1934 length:204 start_codon:yes stop_codon:yes gene_type:complete